MRACLTSRKRHCDVYVVKEAGSIAKPLFKHINYGKYTVLLCFMAVPPFCKARIRRNVLWHHVAHCISTQWGLCALQLQFPPLPLTLLTQIEFYFGDANLPKDKFLQQKISENPDGCKHVASFPARPSHRPLAVCKNRVGKPGSFHHMNDVK